MGLSVALATGLYGVSFGALSVAAGLSILQTQLLSAVMFTGASQFAFVGSIAAGGPAALGAATLLGVRNGIYAAELNREFAPRGWRRFVGAHLTIDESFATAMAQDADTERRRGFWVAGVGVWLAWNLFTLVGALAGDLLGDPKAWGLDGAAVAAFLGLLWPRLKDRDAVSVALGAALVTIVAIPTLPVGTPLLVVALLAALAGLRPRAGRP